MIAHNGVFSEEEAQADPRSHIVRVGLPAPSFKGQACIEGEIRELSLEVVSNLNLGRSTDETLWALEALQTGELRPLNWQPGQPTLGKA